MMIEEINQVLFTFINQYTGLSPFIDSIAVVAAQYMPIIFALWLIYLWIKKGNKHKNIVLYSLYAAILGLILNFVIKIFYFHPKPFMVPVWIPLFSVSAGTSFPSDQVTFMLSVALMMIYFKETRKSGIVLFILGITGGFVNIFSDVNFPLDIFGSVGIAIVSTVIIYLFKEKLAPLNQIFRLIYQILK